MTATTEVPPTNGTGDTAAAAAAIAKTTQRATAVGIPDLSTLGPAIAAFEQAKLETKDVVVESDDFIDAIFCAIASRTHLYVVGSGGVGKSFGMEEASRHFGVETFAIQFRNDTKREEVFGPLSMMGLQQDLYLHVTKGYLPEAQLAILDEIKDGGRFNRQLLTALNERIMDNGGQRMPIPLETAVGLTNFWMGEPELAALFDRFAQRMEQEEIKTSEGFKKVLREQVARRHAKANGVDVTAKYTVLAPEQLRVIQHAVETCEVSEDIYAKLDELRTEAAGNGIKFSPRRWGEGVKLAQAVAVLAGRDHVTESDLRIFARVMPNDPDEFATARTMTNDFRDRFTEAIENARAVLTSIQTSLAPHRAKHAKGEAIGGEVFTTVRAEFGALRTQIAEAKVANPGRDTKPFERVLEGLVEEEKFIQRAYLGINV